MNVEWRPFLVIDCDCRLNIERGSPLRRWQGLPVIPENRPVRSEQAFGVEQADKPE